VLSAISVLALCSAADYFSYSPDPQVNRLTAEFMRQSYPPDLEAVTLFNPWGERLNPNQTIPPDFGIRSMAAAHTYAWQLVRFDGYFGSEDDGQHYLTAADGKDNAYYGVPSKETYRVVKNGVPDDLRERVWICLDLPVHAITIAGFPLREAMKADFQEAESVYTIDGTFPANIPTSHHYFRRVRNLQLYCQRKQQYAEHRITKEQYRDPEFRPPDPYQIGDLLFFGHYGDPEGEKGWWRPQHSGIVGTIDHRGLPDRIYNMRVSQSLVDHYNGNINQTRPIAGEQVFFKKFSDRYSLIGYGRITNPFTPPEPEPTTEFTQPIEETPTTKP
jgi:hypothetical protein